MYCWTAAGERQTQKFREQYVRAVLSQEIGWFDTCGASELSTKLAEIVGKVEYLNRMLASLLIFSFLFQHRNRFRMEWEEKLVI